MSESDENFGDLHAAEHKDKKKKTALCIIFYMVISISCYALFIGGLWAIMDAFVPTGKFDWFMDAEKPSEIMLRIIIAGGFGIIGVMGVIGLWFLYPKGTKLIHKMLYPPITKEKFEKGNFLARFITAGLLISIFVIVIGSVLTLIEWIVTEDSVSFQVFLDETPNGLLIMLFSSIFLVFSILVIVFTWVWINGYQKTLKWIALNNARIDRTEIDNVEWSTGVTLYIIILVSILGAALGGAWYGMEAFASYIHWENFGTTTLVIGGLASLVFLALIGGLVLFSRGSYTISRMLFVRKQQISDKLELRQDKNYTKTTTFGLLIAIALVIIGAVGILVQYLLEIASGESQTFIEFLIPLSKGIWITIFSGMLFGGIWVVIFIIYTWTQGYYAFFNAIGSKILRDNEKIERDRHSKSQVVFGVIIYILIWLSVFGIVYGAIWWALEANTIPTLWKFFVYESLGSIFFLLITIGLIFSRRIVFFVSKLLFVRREDIPENVEKQDKIFAIVITIALLVAIGLVVVGSFGLVVDAIIGDSVFDFIGSISYYGVLSMMGSGLVLISLWILIFVIYIWTHGYYFFYIRFLRRISKQ